MADAQLPLGETKAELLRTSESFRQLVSEHQALDSKISHISSQSFVSDQERFEAASMKKQKLLIKDRIEAMIRQRHSTALPRPGTS